MEMCAVGLHFVHVCIKDRGKKGNGVVLCARFQFDFPFYSKTTTAKSLKSKD